MEGVGRSAAAVAGPSCGGGGAGQGSPPGGDEEGVGPESAGGGIRMKGWGQSCQSRPEWAQ